MAPRNLPIMPTVTTGGMWSVWAEPSLHSREGTQAGGTAHAKACQWDHSGFWLEMRAADLGVFEGNWPGSHQAEKLSVFLASLRSSTATRAPPSGHSHRPSRNPPVNGPCFSAPNLQLQPPEGSPRVERVCALESEDLTFAVWLWGNGFASLSLCPPLSRVDKELNSRASLVAQWLRICLLMQGTWVRALVWEDPTCRGATRPVSHSYWACASGACAPQREGPR